MTKTRDKAASFWMQVGSGLLPFADAASDSLPLSRLLRLALFQVTVGMAAVLLTGTLNRVMIVELGVPAWFVALMVALPLVVAPFRALIGFRSDIYSSALGWRRVPFIWMGTVLQFGGLAIMPFALIILSGDTQGSMLTAQLAAGLAFLLVGSGMHVTQTAGLALATDLCHEEQRPQVVSLLFVVLLLGMLLGAAVFGWLLHDFNQVRLIKVIQGAAVVTLVLNVVSLWKQEPRDPARNQFAQNTKPSFKDAWRQLNSDARSARLLVAVALGTAGFTMQDILLEPYGGEVLGLSVSSTTALTAILAGGTLIAFALAARLLHRGIDAHRLAAYGALVGVVAFAIVSIVAGLRIPGLFRVGVALIGFGGGLFVVGTLIACMNQAREGGSGLALGAWGAVQATSAGVAMALGGALRDGVGVLAESGALGDALANPATGYCVVYQLEILLLFATLAVLGPLAAHAGRPMDAKASVGLAELPN
ncbi:MAG: BCD family MFS transporter [Pseudomonadota bacterium]